MTRPTDEGSRLGLTLRERVRLALERARIAPSITTLVETLKLGSGFLFGRTPIQASSSTLSCEPFFIVGSGRSGNTLMRAILSAHEDVVIPPESFCLGPLARQYRALRFLPWDTLCQIIVGRFESQDTFYTWEVELREAYPKLLDLDEEERSLARAIDVIYQHYRAEHAPAATRWGDKTPLNTKHLPWIEAVFPQANFLHMIRDGRDVANSYVSADLYGTLEEAGRRWQKSVDRGRRCGRRVGPDRYHEVRYEDLVSEPETTVQAVCSFLDLPFEATMLEFWKEADELGDTHLSHHENVHNPIRTDSIGKWRRQLDADDREVLNRLLDPTLTELGYEPDRPDEEAG